MKETCARMFRRPRISNLAVLLLTSVTAAGAQPGGERESRSVDAALARAGMTRHVDGRVIAVWNGLAHDIAFAADQFLTFRGQRALAMMHLAMHDAVNSIVPVYRRYAYSGAVVLADPAAAAAQAAHDVLVSEYPDQRDAVDQELAVWLAESPAGTMRERAIALGSGAASAVLASRVGDGWDVQGSYTFRDAPGDYQTTPPWDGFVAQPGFRFARPFVLESPARFRPFPPPPVASRTYARAFEEVRQLGEQNSARRTADQTGAAVWWMEFAEGSVNRLARQMAGEHRLGLWPAARLFAHIGMSLFDTYVAVWDAKYEYNHWRPYTAIRRADTDGNPRTSPDPAWEPLRPTPPHPDYVSAHAAGCSASFAVLENALGHQSFTMETTTAPSGMPMRTFSSFRAAVQECAQSRIYLGWHFRYATEAGIRLGRDVGEYVLRRTLSPVRRSETGG